MDATVIINRLITEFVTKYGLLSLTLNREGVAQLCFDELRLASFNRNWYQFNLHFGFDEESLTLQLSRQMSASWLTLAQLEESLVSMRGPYGLILAAYVLCQQGRRGDGSAGIIMKIHES